MGARAERTSDRTNGFAHARADLDLADPAITDLGLFDAAAVAAVLCTASGDIVHANPAAMELFALDHADSTPTLGDLLDAEPDDLLSVETPTGGIQAVLRPVDARRLAVTVHVRAVDAGDRRLVQIEDRTMLVDRIEALERLADEDVLTGLLNRRGFLAEADRPRRSRGGDGARSRCCSSTSTASSRSTTTTGTTSVTP